MTPQTLSEIIGQDEAVRHLTKLATDGRMPHAMLFVGPDSVGKFTAAQLLARGLLCHNPPSPGDACGVCSACTKVMSGNHADLHLITTDQRQIKIDAIRTAERALRLRPVEGSVKVLLIDDAHRANVQSQNALLKTLEVVGEILRKIVIS